MNERIVLQRQRLAAQRNYLAVIRIVRQERRHVELSPGVGHDAQSYGLAVCDDILGRFTDQLGEGWGLKMAGKR